MIDQRLERALGAIVVSQTISSVAIAINHELTQLAESAIIEAAMTTDIDKQSRLLGAVEAHHRGAEIATRIASEWISRAEVDMESPGTMPTDERGTATDD